MSTLSTSELKNRIAILRDNIRQLTEQGAGAAGALNEELTANRIAQQSDELQKLLAELEARESKR